MQQSPPIPLSTTPPLRRCPRAPAVLATVLVCVASTARAGRVVVHEGGSVKEITVPMVGKGGGGGMHLRLEATRAAQGLALAPWLPRVSSSPAKKGTG